MEKEKTSIRQTQRMTELKNQYDTQKDIERHREKQWLDKKMLEGQVKKDREKANNMTDIKTERDIGGTRHEMDRLRKTGKKTNGSLNRFNLCCCYYCC